MGLDDDIRKIGVPGHYSFDVIFATGLASEDKYISKWELAGVDQCYQNSKEINNGEFAGQPWQRLSQSLLEKLLREKARKNGLVHYSCVDFYTSLR